MRSERVYLPKGRRRHLEVDAALHALQRVGKVKPKFVANAIKKLDFHPENLRATLI